MAEPTDIGTVAPMRNTRGVHIAVMMVAAVTTAASLASCSDGTPAATTTVPPRSTTAATTTMPQEPCTEGLAATVGAANPRFDIVPEPDIFECFSTSSFRALVEYEGTPLDPDNDLTSGVSVTSEQALVSGDIRSRTVSIVTGTRYETIAVGDDVRMADGTPAAGSIPDEAIAAQAAVGTALADAVLELGALAEDIGDETIDGRLLTHYRADADALALSFEEAIVRNGGDDIDLVFPDTSLDIWVDPRGYVVRAEFVFDFAGATANGSPVGGVSTGTVTIADLIPRGRGTLRYELTAFGEPFDIDLPG